MVRPNGSYGCRGFTILEIFVVIVIFVLVISLLLPAIQAARGSVRNLECISNLKQLALAENAYSSIHNMFTPSQLKTGTTYSTNYISEFVFLLPHIDQSNLYNSINLPLAMKESRGMVSLENKTARVTTIAVYLCPGEIQPDNLSSYRFNRGVFGGNGPGTGHNGPFSINLLPSIASFSDGLSTSALASERIAGSFVLSAGSVPYDIKVVEGGKNVWKSDASFVPYCDATIDCSFIVDAGKYWFFSSFSDTHYNHYDVPNAPRSDCGLPLANDNGFGRYAARSQHGNHVNVMFGDGHISTVTDNVQLQVWRAIGTHNQADTVGDQF